VFLAFLFIGMALLTFAVVVYHLPPRWFGFLYVLLLVVAVLVGKYFIPRRGDSSEQKPEAIAEGSADEATRRRLRSSLVSAKFFLALFTLGFVVFIRELLTGSLSIPWWAELECGLIGLLLLSWAIRQVIYFKKRLGSHERSATIRPELPGKSKEFRGQG
jgi:membrane protein implicated in regulation of membrane protease activity